MKVKSKDLSKFHGRVFQVLDERVSGDYLVRYFVGSTDVYSEGYPYMEFYEIFSLRQQDSITVDMYRWGREVSLKCFNYETSSGGNAPVKRVFIGLPKGQYIPSDEMHSLKYLANKWKKLTDMYKIALKRHES